MSDAAGTRRRVIVTQAATVGRLASALRSRGADVWELPTIRIESPETWDDLDRALRQWGEFVWTVFTSANAVSPVSARLGQLDVARTGPSVAVVGEATARAARAAGFDVRFVAQESSGSGLAAELAASSELKGASVLFPCSSIARSDLPDGLRAAGAEVLEVVAYRTLPAPLDGAWLRRAFADGSIGAITFTSPSTVEHFSRALGGRSLDEAIPDSVVVASIGPTTSRALADHGRSPDIVAPEPAADALADAVIHALEGVPS